MSKQLGSMYPEVHIDAAQAFALKAKLLGVCHSSETQCMYKTLCKASVWTYRKATHSCSAAAC